jgi:GT2 family glycosyltransferase
MKRDLRLSICVVLYGAADVSRRFARLLAASLEDYREWEIIFYDNSPTDELTDLCCYGLYTHDPANRGFSFGNNQAILAARYENIALVNPDVFGFSPSFWERVQEDMIGHDDVRFVRLINADGSFQDCVGEVTSLSRVWRARPDYAAMRGVHPIGMGIMAFMLTSRDVIARVGLLDCDYALYAEDMDWCHRELTHLGGASASNRWSRRQALRKKYRAERTFIDKHRRGIGWIALRCLNWVKQKVRA